FRYLSWVPSDLPVVLKHSFSPWFVIPGRMERRKQVSNLLLIKAIEASYTRIKLSLHIVSLVTRDGAVVDTYLRCPVSIAVIDSSETTSERYDSQPSPMIALGRWYGERVEHGESHVSFYALSCNPIKNPGREKRQNIRLICFVAFDTY